MVTESDMPWSLNWPAELSSHVGSSAVITALWCIELLMTVVKIGIDGVTIMYIISQKYEPLLCVNRLPSILQNTSTITTYYVTIS